MKLVEKVRLGSVTQLPTLFVLIFFTDALCKRAFWAILLKIQPLSENGAGVSVKASLE